MNADRSKYAHLTFVCEASGLAFLLFAAFFDAPLSTCLWDLVSDTVLMTILMSCCLICFATAHLVRRLSCGIN